MSHPVQAVLADITQLQIDCIVNAANESLLGGGGVDGAIHQAAGPALLDECRRLRGCKTGEAKMTAGYQLLAQYVIHTVGPVWQGGDRKEADLLANCYQNVLQAAIGLRVKSIAFPAISCGVYGYPLDQAVRIAVREIAIFGKLDQFDKVIFACFSRDMLELYEKEITLVLTKS